jgi:hypothetical protein
MNRTLVALASALAIGLAIAPLVPSAAVAADAPPAIAWSVQPATQAGRDGRLAFAYGVNPGTQIDDFVVISNVGTQAQTFNVYATDALTQLDTGSFGLLPANIKPKDLGSWVTMKTNRVTVQPQHSAVVPFEILVPSDATPGDHTAGVIASVTTAAPGNKNGIGIDQRVAARVYLRVAGQPISRVAATGAVVGFGPSWNPFGGGDATVDFDVRNGGNVREDVAQKVTLSGPFGITLATIKTAPVVNLLPGQAAHVHAKVSGIAPLLLLFADIKLTPSAPTDLVDESQLRDQNGSLLPKLEEPTFTAASSTAMSIAVSWTLLAIVILLIALIYLISRYVRTTRERMFDAIDAATEQARREALVGAGLAPKEKATAGASGSQS